MPFKRLTPRRVNKLWENQKFWRRRLFPSSFSYMRSGESHLKGWKKCHMFFKKCKFIYFACLSWILCTLGDGKTVSLSLFPGDLLFVTSASLRILFQPRNGPLPTPPSTDETSTVYFIRSFLLNFQGVCFPLRKPGQCCTKKVLFNMKCRSDHQISDESASDST